MDLNSIVIELVRKGGFSKPSYSIRIHGNGKVVYTGHKNVDYKGTVEYRIDENKIFELLDELKKTDFFSIKNNFLINNTNEQSIVNLSFYYKDENNIIKKKTIEHNFYDPKVPSELKKFEEKIDYIVNSSKFINKKESSEIKKDEKTSQKNKKKYACIAVCILIVAIFIFSYSLGFFDFFLEESIDKEDDQQNGDNQIIDNDTNTSQEMGNPEIIYMITTNQSTRENNNRSEPKSVFNKGETVCVDFEFQNVTHNNSYGITAEIEVKFDGDQYYSNTDYYYSDNSSSDVFYLIFTFDTDTSWPSSNFDELYVVSINIYDNISNKSTEKEVFFFLLEEDTSKWSDITFESAILGGNYLINATNNGIFVYNYDPITDTESSSYNILRHSGTIYSMLQLYDLTNDGNLLASAEDAIEYLLLFEKPFNSNSTCIVYNDEVKLGGAGLAIIALAEHAITTGENTYLSNMQNLAKYIKISQEESGKFISKRYYSTGEIDDWDSSYYPGEAILGLCRLYSLDNNETWLDIAEKGSKYLINQRKNIQTNDLVHDHWLVMALNELYRYRNNLSYFNHSIRIAKSIMNSQKDDVNDILENPNWLGSYYTPPRSTPTATRSEGLIAAYHLSNDFGNQETTNRILNSIKLGIQFQLQTQFTENNIVDLPNPEKAIGGFHESLTDYDISVDYVQHNICSMIGLYKILN